MVARGANVSANWSARLWTSSYAMHESSAEWRGARSTAATLELRASCLMLSVTRAWAVSWNVRSSPSLFLLVARTRDQIRALAVSVRRLSLDISISLSGFRCRTPGNSREFRGGTFNGLKNDFAPLRIPPVPRSFYQRKQSLSQVILPTTSFPTMPVCDMWVVFSPRSSPLTLVVLLGRREAATSRRNVKLHE